MVGGVSFVQRWSFVPVLGKSIALIKSCTVEAIGLHHLRRNRLRAIAKDERAVKSLNGQTAAMQTTLFGGMIALWQSAFGVFNDS